MRRALRKSFLADLVLRRIDPSDWLVRGSVRVHDRGEVVTSLLVDRLADAAERDGHGLLMVLQWLPGTDSRRTSLIIKRAKEREVALLLIEELLCRAIESPGVSEEDFFHESKQSGGERQIGHMSAAGNAFVADAISRHPAL